VATDDGHQKEGHDVEGISEPKRLAPELESMTERYGGFRPAVDAVGYHG